MQRLRSRGSLRQDSRHNLVDSRPRGLLLANRSISLQVPCLLIRIHCIYYKSFPRSSRKPYRFLKVCLTAANKASPSVLARSRTLTLPGSVRPPAAPSVMTGILKRLQCAIKAAFAIWLSPQSITRSKSPQSSLQPSCWLQKHDHSGSLCGLISRHRAAITSTFD